MAIDFVIVGVGRSGSSLLQSMIASHPGIAMPPETGFLRRAVFSLRPFSTMTAREAAARHPRLLRVINASTEASNRRYDSGFDLYCSLMNELKQTSEKRLIGDKDPKLIEYLGPVSRRFPGIKVIHIIRDPRDVLLSRKEAVWSAGRPLALQLTTMRAQYRLAESTAGTLGSRQYMVVRYEELVRRPEPTLQEICRFLDLDYSNAMLSFQEAARALAFADEISWKKETTGPLNPANSGKWKTGLTPFEAELTRRVCGTSTGRKAMDTLPERPDAYSAFEVNRSGGRGGGSPEPGRPGRGGPADAAGAAALPFSSRMNLALLAGIIRLMAAAYRAGRRLHTTLLLRWKS